MMNHFIFMIHHLFITHLLTTNHYILPQLLHVSFHISIIFSQVQLEPFLIHKQVTVRSYSLHHLLEVIPQALTVFRQLQVQLNHHPVQRMEQKKVGRERTR